ncbi:MAG: DUF4388 domain-containing protein [Calditrichae bacterium]|nr:DUF4388 domain-containing protein [Calditrichia bacterium]
MKEVFIVSENEEIFSMFTAHLSYLPVHFSWVGNMDSAEKLFRSEKPDFVFFAVKKLTLLNNWLARYKSYKLKIPYLCFVSNVGWEKRELLWMAGAAEVIELPKLKKEFVQIVESVLVPKNSEVEPDFLSGNLNIFNIIDLIKTFEESDRNGVVELKSRNRVGQLQFNKGKLVHAIYDSRDPLEAVLSMSIWNEGIFSVKPDSVRHSQLIKLDNQQIIKECQDFIVEREKILSSLPDNDVVYYSAPMLNYEELGAQIRQNLLFFKNGRTLKDFLEQDEDGSVRMLRELKSWIDKNWLLNRPAFKEQQLLMKEKENSSAVKKMLSKVFSRKENENKNTVEPVAETPSLETELAKDSLKKKYLFSDYDYLMQFADALEAKN